MEGERLLISVNIIEPSQLGTELQNNLREKIDFLQWNNNYTNNVLLSSHNISQKAAGIFYCAERKRMQIFNSRIKEE